ncbi:MAG: von Willebrand factor type A domain-containing protein [Bacilli bacterium]
MKKLGFIFSILALLTFVSCSANNKGVNGFYAPSGSITMDESFGNMDNNEYLELLEKGFIETSVNNKVNVSLDSSSAAYSNIRKQINNMHPIPSDAVNIEQMLNYFNYSYVNDSNEQLKSFMEIAACPWNSDNYLLSLAVKAKEFTIENKVKNNFVFLLDVSGSMYSYDKLPLMIEAFKLLIDNLNDEDRISIVTYAGTDKVLLDGGYGYEKTKLSAIISDLTASGSTAGSKGIKTAYELAQKHFIEGGNNRVFLATDGDFNVGISSTKGLEDFISEQRKTGIYLSLFGFGYGNLKSDKMDTLASCGNGNYYYIDSILEAQKVFVNELGGTLQTVAKDAKVQVEFNPELVSKYRVIGYENKILTDDEFNNSETDAGEIGAGHTTVCLIEFALKDSTYNETIPQTIAKCILRYKDVLDSEMNKEIINNATSITTSPSHDFCFQAAVAEFGLILRNSNFKGNASLESIIDRLTNSDCINDIYKQEFLDLVNKYKNDYRN